MKRFFTGLSFVLISELAGIIGSIFTFSSISSWYININKPFFNPPNWIFGPVWTILYVLIGLSAFLVWEKKFKKYYSRKALSVWSIQLILNSIWSILFFGLKNPLLAFIEIIVLWFFILKAILMFYKINKYAAYLLIPYIAWVSFASILNLSIVVLN